MRGQRESRAEESEERSVLDASSVDNREKCSAGGSRERTADVRESGKRALRFRLVVVGREV